MLILELLYVSLLDPLTNVLLVLVLQLPFLEFVGFLLLGGAVNERQQVLALLRITELQVHIPHSQGVELDLHVVIGEEELLECATLGIIILIEQALDLETLDLFGGLHLDPLDFFLVGSRVDVEVQLLHADALDGLTVLLLPLQNVHIIGAFVVLLIFVVEEFLLDRLDVG